MSNRKILKEKLPPNFVETIDKWFQSRNTARQALDMSRIGSGKWYAILNEDAYNIITIWQLERALIKWGYLYNKDQETLKELESTAVKESELPAHIPQKVILQEVPRDLLLWLTARSHRARLSRNTYIINILDKYQKTCTLQGREF